MGGVGKDVGKKPALVVRACWAEGPRGHHARFVGTLAGIAFRRRIAGDLHSPPRTALPSPSKLSPTRREDTDGQGDPHE
jgi:hypothetical protein